MVFSSLEFMYFYFPIVMVAYFITPLKWRNLVLFLVSLAFYGWGEPVYLFLMLFTIVVEYICGLFVEKYRDDKPKAKAAIAISVIINLSILGFFKYASFIVSNLALIPAFSALRDISPDSFPALPIGISFYTFQAISYTIDLYRGEGKVQRNLSTFGAYVTLFPQLIAGPIVRYKDVDDQLNYRKDSVILFSNGVRTFAAGLAKKVLLANTAGALWTQIKGVPSGEMTVITAWLGILCYTFQIYFDFSAYSDMAIGLGKMLGLTFLENFNYPYISKSITEFWRRWHMSLSTWFREYLYFPLGGSRKGTFKTYRNLAIVWLCTGIWHGASWNYILWGVYFGVIIIAEKAFMLNILEKTPAFLRHIYTMLIVVFSWLIFSFEDLTKGVRHLGYMFGQGEKGFADAGSLYDLVHFLPYLAIFVIASTPLVKNWFNRAHQSSKVVRIAAPVVALVSVVVCTAYLVDSSFNPFLYFRF